MKIGKYFFHQRERTENAKKPFKLLEIEQWSNTINDFDEKSPQNG